MSDPAAVIIPVVAKGKKNRKVIAPKPTVSMVKIHEHQFDKFAETIEPIDYGNTEFNIFIQTEIIEKRSCKCFPILAETLAISTLR